jgi:hypothetical protein
LIDIAKHEVFETSLKINDFVVFTISGKDCHEDYHKYIGEGYITLLEIKCEDGIFLVLLPEEAHEKAW